MPLGDAARLMLEASASGTHRTGARCSAMHAARTPRVAQTPPRNPSYRLIDTVTFEPSRIVIDFEPAVEIDNHLT